MRSFMVNWTSDFLLGHNPPNFICLRPEPVWAWNFPMKLGFSPGKNKIDLSVSPSPRAQTSQWQSSISSTGSETQTSLGFSAIKKHWKIQSSHWFYGFMIQKWKNYACGTRKTDFMYPERMGNICFITFPESKQNSKMSPSIQPQYK